MNIFYGIIANIYCQYSIHIPPEGLVETLVLELGGLQALAYHLQASARPSVRKIGPLALAFCKPSDRAKISTLVCAYSER